MEMPGLLSLAARAARHAADRQAVTARNVVNADTPGYRPSDLTAFRAEASTFEVRATRPGHLAGRDATPWRVVEVDGPLDPNGNGVDLETEILRGVEAQRAHGRAVTVYQSALELMRTSIGRR